MKTTNSPGRTSFMKSFWKLLIIVTFLGIISTTNSLSARSLGNNYEPPAPKQVVVNPKIISNNNVDLTSMDAIIGSIIKPGMTDKEKAFAVYNLLTECGYEAVYPTDCADTYWHTCQYEPVKFLNIFPWGECGTYQGLLAELLTAAGVPARKIEMNGHWVTEAFFENSWHYLDPRWKTYFFKRDGKTIASCEDLTNDTTLILDPVNRDVLGYSPSDEWLHEWAKLFAYTIIIKDEYADKNGIHYPAGNYHTMNINLARGDEYILSTEKEGDKGYWYYPDDLSESYLKAAINRNHHTIQFPGTGPQPIKNSKVSGHWKFPGFSNSKLIYTPDFRSGSYIDRVVEENNITACSDDVPYLYPKTSNQPAYVIFEIQSPYIMVHNLMEVDIVSKNKNDKYKISISSDDGQTWKELPESDAYTDISQYVYGGYKYRIKFELFTSGRNTDIGISSLRLTNIFQSSPITVPRLEKGVNEIKVSLGNPEIIGKCRLFTEYCWKEKDTDTSAEIEKTEKREVTSSPMKYKIVCNNETEPVTRYVKMMVR